ncbi:MAG: ArsA family ATPase [Candidatus Hydrogenedentota bacterium]|nr:MAG: ArsA family ATPase [Candidatus Hydrogenedentota bacterium]
MQFDELIERREVIICCGSGGVGKTTTAAAIAIHAATLGRKVIVLTIDPAKRLANSLGLAELGNEERRVSPRKFAEAGISAKGELYAMMLDTKRTFDELIIKYSLNQEMQDRILDNVLYKNISSAFAGSQEYMAMEKLFEIHTQGKYDLIILDTPPTKHALDFLDAPKRMTDFLDGSVLKWFLKPYFSAGKAGIRMFHKGTAVILRTLERITGVAALKAASDFFLDFEGMYDGFKERAQAVYELLRDGETGFLLVTSPEDITIEEAMYFYDKLVEYELPFCGLIINRVHTGFGSDAAAERVIADDDAEILVKKMSDALAKTASERKAMHAVAAELVRNLSNFRSLAEIDAESIRRLTNHVDTGTPFRIIPFFDTDVYDIEGLTQINRYVFGPG